MMKVIFAALLLVGVSTAYKLEVPDDYSDLVRFVFGSPTKQNNARVRRQQNQVEWENSVCECVPYYQCNYNGTMNESGEGIIDIRVGFVGTEEKAA